jgi:hypothetical protein
MRNQLEAMIAHQAERVTRAPGTADLTVLRAEDLAERPATPEERPGLYL